MPKQMPRSGRLSSSANLRSGSRSAARLQVFHRDAKRAGRPAERASPRSRGDLGVARRYARSPQELDCVLDASKVPKAIVHDRDHGLGNVEGQRPATILLLQEILVCPLVEHVLESALVHVEAFEILGQVLVRGIWRRRSLKARDPASSSSLPRRMSMPTSCEQRPQPNFRNVQSTCGGRRVPCPSARNSCRCPSKRLLALSETAMLLCHQIMLVRVPILEM